MMSDQPESVHLAGMVMGGTRHACAFFHSPAEEYGVMVPFIKEGLERNDKALHIVEPERRSDLVHQLDGVGLDTDGLQETGQLEIRTWEQAHIQGRRFDQESWLAMLEETLAGHRANGYPQTRLWSNQEWALEEVQGTDDIVEYESRFNYIAAKFADPVVCVFDLTRFDAAIMIDILRTHPMVVVGGQLHENPFYVPPDQFLVELRARRRQAAV
jgi:hypothetical protein